MNDDESDFRPRPDADAVQHPALRAMVEAARAQPMPQVKVDAEAIHAAWEEHRGRRRRAIGLGLVAAASIALVFGLATRGGPTAGSDPTTRSGVVAQADAPATEAPATPEAAPTPGPQAPAVAQLAEGLVVEPRGDTSAEPEILGPHRLRLPEGEWSVDAQTSALVEVVLPERTAQLRGGLIHVQVAGDVARVEVLRHEVSFLDAQGQPVPAEPAPAATHRASLGAEALAREAEVHLAAGRRGEAIKSLRRLVTQHPRAAAAQTGLLDLGRLLERAGQPDRARCAYAVFLDRWPRHPLHDDVAAAHRKLGPGAQCRGLRPLPP